MKRNEASSSFELASAVYRSGILYFRKRNVNRVWKSRWSQFSESLGLGALILVLHSRAQSRGGDRYIRKGRRYFSASFLYRSGECEGGYCRDSSPLTSFTQVRQANNKVWNAFPISESRNSTVRGYLRKSSPFTSFLLTFGKLTLKIEMLSQFWKVKPHHCGK